MIMFDVGSHRGHFAKKFLSENPDSTVYCFEPVPEILYSFLYPFQSEHFQVIPCAVTDFNGLSTFNIAGGGDWGCGSLSEFSTNIESVWKGELGFFEVTKKIIVPTIRLDTFIEHTKVSEIDFLKIDAQGSDIKVLKSLGEYINIVKSGMVEVYLHSKLYKDSENEKESTINFLKDKGFKHFEELDNDQNECNIKFSR